MGFFLINIVHKLFLRYRGKHKKKGSFDLFNALANSMLTLTRFNFNEFTFYLTGDSNCFFKCSEINHFEKATSQRLLLLDHRSLIKNKTETAVINIVNLLHIPNGTHSLIAS